MPGPGAAASGGRAGRILVVEDHGLLAETLSLGLAANGFECTVAELEGTPTIVEQAARLRPAVVLLDLDLFRADGLELVSGLRATGAAVLVVTGCTDERRLAAALALGAVGWVSKSEPFERLLAAAERAAHDRPLLPHALHRELVELGRQRLHEERELESRVAELSGREREVLAALLAGETAQQIADRFVLSLGTVRTHIRAILGKLGVSTQLAAVATVGRLTPRTARALRSER